jgi:hypothetical protein
VVRLEPAVEGAHGDLNYWDEVYDDSLHDEGAHHADCEYCGTTGEWWAPTMPPRAFLQNGLVHMTTLWDGTQAYCGAPAVPYGVTLHSTDAVHAYARQLSAEAGEVTCFECIVRDFDLEPRGRWRR